MRVVRYLAGLAAKGAPIHYLAGNHDELLRKFAGLKIRQFHLDNKLVLGLPHGRTWPFHGDVFDVRGEHWAHNEPLPRRSPVAGQPAQSRPFGGPAAKIVPVP
ncbi:MAG: hypothetical protein ACRYFR_16275 [Janthinobacterium lividum]